MKTPLPIRRSQFYPLGIAVWLILCIAFVMYCRDHGMAATLESVNAQEELASQSRHHLPLDDSFATKLARAALDRTAHLVRYEPAYVSLPYPGGDVPADTGVCTDEVIRAYRAIGFDLQKLVHEDMKEDFNAYPKQWGLRRPDSNIDHRRVPNLQTFFKRHGAALPVTDRPEAFIPGDLITCTVPPHLPHIAMVVPAPDGGSKPWIVHNIGRGPQLEDRLFEFPLTGHYRWHPQP